MSSNSVAGKRIFFKSLETASFSASQLGSIWAVRLRFASRFLGGKSSIDMFFGGDCTIVEDEWDIEDELYVSMWEEGRL